MTCATYSINKLVFITEMKSVYSAVRTGSLNRAVCVSSFKGLICVGRALHRIRKSNRDMTAFNMVKIFCPFCRVQTQNVFMMVYHLTSVSSTLILSILYFFKIHFNIIFLPALRCRSQWSRDLRSTPAAARLLR